MFSSRRFVLLLAFLLLGVAMLVPIHFEVNVAFWDALMDSTHVPIFAGLAWLLAATNPLGVSARRDRTIVAAGLALATAVAIEILQGFTGRTPSLSDVGFGALGIGCASVFSMQWRWLAAGLSLASACIALAPVAREGAGLVWRARHFPVLGDFEEAAELRLWIPSGRQPETGKSIKLAAEHPTHGGHALRVRFLPGAFPGVRLFCADQDWSAYHSLAFDIYNEGTPFPLSLRIDDARSKSRPDRANLTVQIEQGTNTFRLPLAEIATNPKARSLDLHKIRQMLFFEQYTSAEHQIDLDDVRLE